MQKTPSKLSLKRELDDCLFAGSRIKFFNIKKYLNIDNVLFRRKKI
jgi:hypothetical protein